MAPSRNESRWDRAAAALASEWALTAILLLAAVLRVVHVLSLRELPLFDRLILDSGYYDAWARRITAGDWMGEERAFFFDPLYTYVLAVVYRVVGHDVLVVRLLNVALGVATCALVAGIGRHVRGRAAGDLAALLVALYGPAIYQEGGRRRLACSSSPRRCASRWATRSGRGWRPGWC